MIGETKDVINYFYLFDYKLMPVTFRVFIQTATS